MSSVFWVSVLMACGSGIVDEKAVDGGEQAGSFSVLTYNVHGLPALITGDNTGDRMADIAGRLSGFDLMGIQEDWMAEHHDVLVGQVAHRTRDWFDESKSGRVYGAGLTTLANFEVLEQHQVHYSTCNGTLDGASDCLASKGFQATRFRVGNTSFDFYNTHLEAGGSADDNEAREVQVAEVLDFMDSWSTGHAIIFTGDFNLHVSSVVDAALLSSIQSSEGLTDSCVSVSCPEEGHIDRVWFRTGSETDVSVSDWNNLSTAFLDAGGIDLSDHPPISVQVEWSSL